MNNINDLQMATNDTILKMVDNFNIMNRRMYKITLICVVSTAIVFTSLFGGVLYFLNTFEVEATTTETIQTIEGDGKINNIEGDGTINDIQTEGDVTVGGEK